MRKHYPLNSQGAEDAGQLPWKDGVPSTGVEGSYPGSALFIDTEAEILAAIDAAGLVRNGSDLTQLLQAIARGGPWLGQIGGSGTALTATVPNGAVIPALLAGMRVRGIAAANFTGTGGTLAITGIGSAGNTVSYPLVGSDGVTALSSGAWVAGQFLTFDIDASGNARFGGGSGSGSSGSLAGLTPQQLFKRFLTSGTYMIPARSVEVWMTGAGGGGNPGVGGGAGAELVDVLTGLTIGNTLTVQIGAPGTGSTTSGGTGSAGGDTVLSSGTQTIATRTAGGGKGASGSSGGVGGTASITGTASGSEILSQGNGGSNGVGGIAQPFAPFGNGGSPAMNGVIINGTTVANQNGGQGIILLKAVGL